MKRRTDVVNETRHGELGAAHAAPGRVLGFVDDHVESSALQRNCRAQTVGARADDRRISKISGHFCKPLRHQPGSLAVEEIRTVPEPEASCAIAARSHVIAAERPRPPGWSAPR